MLGRTVVVVYWYAMRTSDPHQQELYRLFAVVDTPKEAEMLLQDLLTPQELASLSERWQLIQKLHAGEPQRDIAQELGVSISKITRGSRMLQYGSGGFAYFLKKLGVSKRKMRLFR
ncbi:MAG: Trp family transcriptional regulator [Patescibacteria group bacterium]